MSPSQFLERLRSELELLLERKRSAPDFVGRFYFLADEQPLLPARFRSLFEDFHTQVANFEPHEEIRRRELGLIDEAELRDEARNFLAALKGTGLDTHER